MCATKIIDNVVKHQLYGFRVEGVWLGDMTTCMGIYNSLCVDVHVSDLAI